MLKKSEFWMLTIIAVLVAVFSVVNMMLFQINRNAQIEVNGRQQFIQQSLQLQGLYNEMIKALADLAIRNQDADLGNLLAAQGISISGGSTAPAGGARPAETPKGAQ
jgi:hypothetical protein